MNAGFLDATRAEVEYRAAELQRAATRSRRRPNRMLHWLRTHRSTPVSVPRQERRIPAAEADRGRV